MARLQRLLLSVCLVLLLLSHAVALEPLVQRKRDLSKKAESHSLKPDPQQRRPSAAAASAANSTNPNPNSNSSNQSAFKAGPVVPHQGPRRFAFLRFADPVVSYVSQLPRLKRLPLLSISVYALSRLVQFQFRRIAMTAFTSFGGWYVVSLARRLLMKGELPPPLNGGEPLPNMDAKSILDEGRVRIMSAVQETIVSDWKSLRDEVHDSLLQAWQDPENSGQRENLICAAVGALLSINL